RHAGARRRHRRLRARVPEEGGVGDARARVSATRLVMGSARTTTVRAAVGASETFDTVEAAAEAADRARAALEPPCDLALVFAPGHHRGMAKWLLSEVHDRLEPPARIGCGAGGR